MTISTPKNDGPRSTAAPKGDQYLKRAEDALSSRRYEAALEYATVALEEYQKANHHPGELRALSVLGSTHSYRLEMQSAVQYFQRALELSRNIGDRQQEAHILASLGSASQSMNEMQRADQFYEQALAIAREMNDRSTIALALAGLGKNALRSGSNNKAREYLLKALESYEEAGDRTGIADVLVDLGQVARLTDRLDEASNYYQQALKFGDKDDRRTATVLVGLGQISHAVGDFANSQRYLNDAIALYDKLNDVEGRARATNLIKEFASGPEPRTHNPVPDRRPRSQPTRSPSFLSNLSPSSRQAIEIAENLRRQIKNPDGSKIFTEMLLVGLNAKTGGPTNVMLSAFGIDRDRLMAGIATLRSWEFPPNLMIAPVLVSDEEIARLPFSSNMLRILERASVIGTERAGQIRSRHLLLALLENHQSKAYECLKSMGIPTDQVQITLDQASESQTITRTMFTFGTDDAAADHSPIGNQSVESGNKQPPPDLSDTTTSDSERPSQPEVLSEITKQFTIQDAALEKHATSDKPIQHVKQDRLEFRTYVSALRDFIDSKYTSTPITISIDGPWGTGKSSLMYMLKGKLDPQRGIVRRLYEWGAGILPWCKWFLGFMSAFLINGFGEFLIAMVVRKDDDDPGTHLYFFGDNPDFLSFVSNIVKGFSIDPEILNEPADNSVDERVLWWAKIHAMCEPMQPRYHYAVWLNAWKFDNQQEVWASLALATMEQIKQKHNALWRLWFWWSLTFSRFSFWSAVRQVIQQFLLPLLFALVAATYDVVAGSADKALPAFSPFGSALLWTGFIISGILKVAGLFKDPFQISFDEILDHPNYKDKVSLLARFEKDFAKIVQCATKNSWGWKRSKLIIFIDDLDRCEPPKAADIVEAINLFLDAEGCVFVVGMDSETVAVSIEAKYKDLYDRMRLEGSGSLSLGKMFLDKIVQIPFTVPQPTSGQIMRMVEDSLPYIASTAEIATKAERPLPVPDEAAPVTVPVAQVAEDAKEESATPIIEPRRPDVASLAHADVRDAILWGAALLNENPRQAKTFLNLFRLSIYIANERGILEERRIGDITSGIDLNTLAVWVACSFRWPSLLKHLHDETQTQSLRQYLAELSSRVLSSYSWEGKVFTETMNNLAATRNAQSNSVAHWCHLPWGRWLLEPDFVKMLKLMAKLWSPRKADVLVDDLWSGAYQENGRDWLGVLLTMTKPISQ